MKNFFKKIKEAFTDFANYNKDEAVSDKKSEVGKQVEPARSDRDQVKFVTRDKSTGLEEPRKKKYYHNKKKGQFKRKEGEKEPFNKRKEGEFKQGPVSKEQREGEDKRGMNKRREGEPKEPVRRRDPEKEPVKTNHAVNKNYRKRENVSPMPERDNKGKVQDDPEKLAKRTHGKYNKENKDNPGNRPKE